MSGVNNNPFPVEEIRSKQIDLLYQEWMSGLGEEEVLLLEGQEEHIKNLISDILIFKEQLKK